MTTPLRIPCETMANIPAVTELQRLATEEQDVVLIFPCTEENENAWKPLGERLEEEMPDHTIYINGEKRLPFESIRVTIRMLMSEAEVLAHAEEIVAAAQQFRVVATERMTQLAAHLGVSLDAFDNPLFRMRYKPTAPQQRGKLEGGWSYAFHGMECTFRHSLKGQYLDVILGFPNEFGALDSYFFAQFIRSTPGWETIKLLFKDNDYYYSRALNVLEKYGYLMRVYAGNEGHPDSRPAARQPDRQT